MDYENYIWLTKGDSNVVSFFSDNTGKFEDIVDLGQKDIQSVSAIGNTLILSTEEKTVWVLYKLGKYTVLGDKLPFPRFELFAKEHDSQKKIEDKSPLVWRRINNCFLYRSGSYDEEKDIEIGNYLVSLKRIHEEIASMVESNRSIGLLNSQSMFVVGLRLYDDTYVVSSPYLLSPGYEFPYQLSYLQHEEEYWDYTPEGDVKKEEWIHNVDINMKTLYRPVFRINETETFFDAWSDVVKSVDVFMSPKLYHTHYHKYRFKPYNVDETFHPMHPGGTGTSLSFDFFFGTKSWSYEDELESMSNFFLVRSYSVSKDSTIDKDVVGKMITGEEFDLRHMEIDGEFKDVSKDTDLMTQRSLPVEADNKGYRITFNQSTIFNNRIVASGVKQIITFDKDALSSAKYTDPVGGVITRYRYEIKYLLQTSTGKEYVLNNTAISKLYGQSISIMEEEYDVSPYAIIFCPDERARKVEIKEIQIHDSQDFGYTEVVTGSKVFAMKNHSFLPCSYFYGGPNTLHDLVSGKNESLSMGIDSLTDNQADKLFVSEINNPLVFPIKYRYSFPYEVIGTAIATAEMSTGQFGQFPLYVFTGGGIWAMEVNSEGDFVTNKPLSRFIALSNKGIQSIDNAVVFPTEKGLMAISGSQVTELSPNMLGKHYSLEESVAPTILKWQEGDNYDVLPSITDEYGNFMSFLKTADIVYDYIGNRLILFNSSSSYAYLLYMKSSTWHKITLPDGCSFMTSLNSYPQAKVVLANSKAIHKLLKVTDLRGKTVEFIGNGLYQYLVGHKRLDLTMEDCKNIASGTPFDLTFYDDGHSVSSLESDLRGLMETANVGFQIYNGYATEHSVYDYSTLLSQDDTSTEVDSVIITRTIDLDNPDVLKTINHLKIRGRYERYYESDEVLLTVSRWTTSLRLARLQAIEYSLNQIGVTMDDEWKNKLLDTGSVKVNRRSFNVDEFIRRMGISYTGAAKIEAKVVNKPRVSYMLLGSQDGIHFARLGSLRGKSWKMFRIIILAKLRPHERISWIDIDYETRFTNKLR